MNTIRILIVFLVYGCVMNMTIPADVQGQDDEGRGNVRAVSDNVSVRLGGTLQPRATFASDDDTDRIGFGLRRMRFRAYTDIGERISLFLQMEGSGASATWLDMRGNFRLNDEWTLSTGRFIGAQPRSFARTGHANIDAIDRPAIAERWARMTIGADGRDYGVEATWSRPEWEIRGFLHNGHNRADFRTGISNDPATGGISTDGFAFSASATHWPSGDRNELELGAYAGLNTSQNPLTEIGGVGREYFSYSAHAYWGALPGSQPFRVKADVIGIGYQEVTPFGAHNYMGTSLFGSFLAAPHVELYARGEFWYSDGGDMDGINQVFATVGGSYSLSALWGRPFSQNRIMVAYSLRSAESSSIDFDDPAHVFMVQTQFFF